MSTQPVAVASSSLEPLETKSGTICGHRLKRSDAPHPDFRSQPSTPEEEEFRHRGWSDRRRLVWSALNRTATNPARLDRFAECGAGVWICEAADDGELFLQCDRCHDRWCVPCGVEKARVISDKLIWAMERDRTRLVTLTRKHSPTALTDQIDSIIVCFNRLRTRSWWTQRVRGGASFMEIKLSERSGMWHVHMHLVIDSDYLDQRELSQEWLAVTQDSSIVDVRLVPENSDVARYVTKYVTKPADASVYAVAERLDEMIVALRGRRLVSTFGTWRGIRFNDDDAPARKIRCKYHPAALCSAAAAGDVKAYSVWRAAVLRWPTLSGLGQWHPSQ